MRPWERFGLCRKRKALHEFAVNAAGEKWDPIRLASKYDNNPPESPKLNRLPEDIRNLHAFYDEINPDWEKGYSIAIIAPITVKTLSHAVRRAFKRARRKGRT